VTKAARLGFNGAMTDLSELEARLGDLERKVGMLDDIAQIERLQRAYGYFLDNRMQTEIVDLFSDDGEVEIGSRGIYRGRAAVRTLMVDLLGDNKRGIAIGEVLNHMQLQGIVTVADDGESAKGRWRALLIVGGTNAHGHPEALLAEGLYENEYVKSDGQWLIRRLWWNPTLYWPLPGYDRARFRSLGVSEEFPPTEARDTKPPRVLPFHYPHPVTGQPIVVDF
jgi:SnoaL-like protein